MFFQSQPVILDAGETCFYADQDLDGGIAAECVAEATSQYRPRHPERTALYQLFETHFDSYVRSYEERFEAHCGPLRQVVVRSVEEFLACGRLQGGFARIRCPKCHEEHLLAFSCRTRNFCPSCQAKRAILFSEKLSSEILAPVPHRHWTFSIPRVLRGLFERERSLLGLLSRTAYEAVRLSFQAVLDRKDVGPGCVLSLQTFGAFGANFHPHGHALISDGAFARNGEFLQLPSLDTSAVTEVFRRLLLKRLNQAERLSESFMNNLLSWVHSGFSVYAGPPVAAGDTITLEQQARYISRPAVAMDALQKQQDGAIAMQTEPDPKTGATVILLDPLEWIHRISAHIADPGQHLTRYYGAYSNRSNLRSKDVSAGSITLEEDDEDAIDSSEFNKNARSTWARLIKKIFEVDPLLCRCGTPMKIVSIITDPRIVDRILRHLANEQCRAKDPFEPRGPPQQAGLCQ
jgi:hypothetical protein